MVENGPEQFTRYDPPPAYSSLSRYFIPLSEVENLLKEILTDMRGAVLVKVYHFCRKHNIHDTAKHIEKLMYVQKTVYDPGGTLRSMSTSNLVNDNRSYKLTTQRFTPGPTKLSPCRVTPFEVNSHISKFRTGHLKNESKYVIQENCHCLLLSYCDLTGETIAFVINIHKPSEIQRYLPVPSTKLGPEFASTMHCFAGEGGKLFLSGGKGEAANCLLEYRFSDMKWKSLKRMRNGRSRHSMAILDSTLYVVGGIHNDIEVPIIEGYNITNGNWDVSCRMKIPVRTAPCCVYGESIYIFGGKTGKTRHSTVQTFNPEKNFCEAKITLPCDCSSAQVLCVGDKIYVATGQGQMIIFNPQSLSSQVLEPQFLCKRHFGMICDGNEIYIIGGKYAADTELSSIDNYSIHYNHWKRVGHLSKPMSIYGAHILHN